MSDILLNAQTAWANLLGFWQPFAFLATPGATLAEIAQWETAQGVILSAEVRALMQIHGSFELPTLAYGDFSAETTLAPVRDWLRFDRSILCQDLPPDFWADVFAESKCPSGVVTDYVVIGADAWGADYGIYVLLHVDSSTVFGLTWNIPSIKSLGSMTDWLANRRLRGYTALAAYLKSGWLQDAEPAGGAGVAQQQRFYLSAGYGNSNGLIRWQLVEKQFVDVFDALLSESLPE